MLAVGCKQHAKDGDSSPHVAYSQERTFNKKDSLFLAFTLRQFTRMGSPGFNHALTLSPSQTDSIKPFVDLILYSPDSLKMFAFVISQIPDNEFTRNYKNSELGHYYDCTAIVGFRNGTGEFWRVFHFPQYDGTVYAEYGRARRSLEQYYFTRFKNDGQFVRDGKGGWGFEKFSYNVNEPGFWTGIVWQKGLLADGLYNFQTYKKATFPELTYSELRYPEIEYPDSILALFKE